MATQEEKEAISMIGFEIIAYAGDAMTELLKAADKAAEGAFDEARELHASAKQNLVEAHNVQTGLLSKEAGGATLDMTFIMAHAQDTLMTTMMLEKQMKTIINTYERLAALETRPA